MMLTTKWFMLNRSWPPIGSSMIATGPSCSLNSARTMKSCVKVCVALRLSGERTIASMVRPSCSFDLDCFDSATGDADADRGDKGPNSVLGGALANAACAVVSADRAGTVGGAAPGAAAETPAAGRDALSVASSSAMAERPVSAHLLLRRCCCGRGRRGRGHDAGAGAGAA